MHIIVGLGNPGSMYSETRHNVGFAVVDACAEAGKTRFRPGKGDYWTAGGTISGEEFVLCKPTTMMNNSGVAVRDLLDRTGCPLDGLIVVADDINLPLGTLRFRAHGSDGGHNGMASILYELQTDEVQRLRCGTGTSLEGQGRLNSAEFVLAPFLPEERDDVRTMVLGARDALHQWMIEGIEASMNRWNPRQDV